MSGRILKLSYEGKVVDLKIPDIDKCLLIDVLNDMVDEYGKKGFELPTYPVLHYGYNGKAEYLTDDKTLMAMFDNVSSKIIEVWVGCLEEPNFIWKLAQRVRSEAAPTSKPKPTPKKLDKLPIKRPPINSQPSQPLLNHTPSAPPISIPRRSSRLEGVVLIDEAEFNKCLPNVQQPTPSSLPPSMTFSTAPPSSSNPPLDKPDSAHKIQKKPIRPNPFPHGKKMPRSTAVMKGLWTPKERIEQSVSDDQLQQQGPKLRIRSGSALDELNIVDDTNLEINNSETEPESDEAFIPSHNSDVSSDDDDEVEYSEGDIGELLNHNYVDGAWEAFKSNEWVADDSGYLTRMYENGEAYESVDMGKMRLKVWQLFVDKEQFKDALRDFCVQEGFSIIVERCDSGRYSALCADSRCDWRIYASKLSDGHTWAIKKMSKSHTCDLNLTNNPMVTADWAADKLFEDIKANPDISGKALNALLWERYGINMALSTLYRGKMKAVDAIQGGHDDSYTNLPKYCELLKGNNPGSIAFCIWRTIHQPQKALQFTGIFVSFSAQFRGLISGCRGIVGVDGCHLKGKFGGILLSAVSLDGNNEIFPVAVAVVDSENKSSWSWFFNHLKTLLTETGRDDWTIMSDRQKGIDPSLDEVWPNVPRRYCGRHLCKNFKAVYPGLLMHKLFWTVVNSYSEFVFRKSIKQVQINAGLGAVKWFKDVGPLDRWTRFRFEPSLCCDENTNNFVESFNSTIGVDRSYPILTMLEGVRRIAMVRHATRQQLAEQWPDDGVCPNIVQQLRVLKKDSRFCHAYPSGRGTYEIHDGTARLPLSLNGRTCACGRWQISGIPCKHAIRAILSEGKEPLDYVSDWFKVSAYKQAYNGNIAPVPDEDQWPHIEGIPTLVPPVMKRSVGRPSRNRRREEGEQRKGKRSNTVQCGKCKAYGHNSSTCKGGLTAREQAELEGKKGKPGRKSKKQKTNNNNFENDFNLIEMLIAGTADQFVDGNETSNFFSQPHNEDTSDQPSTTPQKKKRGRKGKEASTTCEDMIEGMITQSQPEDFNPSTSQRSPKAKKIMDRLSQLQ